MFRSLPGFHGKADFKTWLFRIAHNVTMSHFRKIDNRVIELAELQGFARMEAEPNVEAREQVRIVYAALDRFSDEHREAFVLFEFQGMSLKEIAELEQTSINTIASRVRRVREKLRSILERVSFERSSKEEAQ